MLTDNLNGFFLSRRYKYNRIIIMIIIFLGKCKDILYHIIYIYIYIELLSRTESWYVIVEIVCELSKRSIIRYDMSFVINYYIMKLYIIVVSYYVFQFFHLKHL